MIAGLARIARRLGLGLGLVLACDPAPAEAPIPAATPVAESTPADVDLEVEAPPEIEPTAQPPVDPAAIGRWLRGGGYREWAAQSKIHATGEHGGARVLFNPILAASWAAAGERHPIGAAAVRELYEDDLVTPRGFALMVKIADDEAEERRWYWYEVFGVDDEATPTVAQVAAPGCLGCHAGGVDLVMKPEGTAPE